MQKHDRNVIIVIVIVSQLPATLWHMNMDNGQLWYASSDERERVLGDKFSWGLAVRIKLNTMTVFSTQRSLLRSQIG